MTGADRQRLRQVRAAILGDRPDTSLSSALYPVYVAAVAAVSYGVPAAQQLARSVDERWLAEHAWSPAGAIVAVTVTALLMALVWLAGRVHGPVLPPLPYLDLVVASPMPRKVTLARNWRLSLGGSVVGGLMVGAVAGAGLAIAEVASPTVLLPATAGGGLLGVLFAELWLRGQLRDGEMPFGRNDRLPAGSGQGGSHLSRRLSTRRNTLALLDITSLRRQAASTVTMGGAVLAGDLRMVRLDAARPVKRARRVRLRASVPLAVIARRDLLGLRRAPGSALYGLGFTAAGSAGLMLSLLSPRTPTVAPLLSLVVAYLGFGAWCEGLRQHSDNSGTSRLLGLAYRDTAIAHLVVPVSAWSLTTIVSGAGLLLAGLATPAALVWTLGVGTLLAGAHLMAAFRGPPPISAFGQGGVAMMIFWYARPLLATLVVGTATTAWAARAATPWTLFSWLLLASAAVVKWGLTLVDKRDRRD